MTTTDTAPPPGRTTPVAGPDPDPGLLAPLRAGLPAEAATGDRARPQALPDDEAARVRARLETAPEHAARAVPSAAPHQRDPALIRSASHRLPALVAAVPHTAIHDDERPPGARHSGRQRPRACPRPAAGAAHTAAGPTGGPAVHPGRMPADLRLTGGLVAAERLAAALSTDLGRARATTVGGDASAAAARTGGPGADVRTGHPAPGPRSAAGLAPLCAPRHYSGLAGEPAARVLDRCRRDRPCGTA